MSVPWYNLPLAGCSSGSGRRTTPELSLISRSPIQHEGSGVFSIWAPGRIEERARAMRFDGYTTRQKTKTVAGYPSTSLRRREKVQKIGAGRSLLTSKSSDSRARRERRRERTDCQRVVQIRDPQTRGIAANWRSTP